MTGLLIVSEHDDKFNKLYTNQVGDSEGDIPVEWDGGHTVRVAVDKAG